MDDNTHNFVEDYPAEKLSDELRGGIDPSARVTISISVKSEIGPTFEEIFAALHETRIGSDDPVMRVRALREEWDEREQSLVKIRRGRSE